MRRSSEIELQAARNVAARLGLGEIRPEILKLARHTTVRLAPTAVVARIQSRGRSADLDEKLARELTIASHLGRSGAPTVRPASQVDPGPHFENGCSVTLWEFAWGRAAKTNADAWMAAQALQAVHQALQGLTVALPSFTAAFESCEAILNKPSKAPLLDLGDRAFLQEVYAKLRQQLSGCEFRCHPLHGDAHLGNVLITSSGAIWMDLDDVCSGPLEWDVATLPRETWRAFDGVDRHLVRLLADLRSFCVAAWCWADFDRNPEIREAAIYHLKRLKSRFGKQRTRSV